jgi:hypothetical protein
MDHNKSSIIDSYYNQKTDYSFGLDDLNIIETQYASLPQNAITILKMTLLCDILCEKIPKKSDQQLFLFLPPLIKLFDLANTDKTNLELNNAANVLRDSTKLIDVVIRMSSQSLYEACKVIFSYDDKFRELRDYYFTNANKIHRTHKEIRLADAFIKKAMIDISELYYQKMRALSPAELKILGKLLYPKLADRKLNLLEFKEAIIILNRLFLLTEEHIPVLVNAMSLYQSLLIMKGLKNKPKKNELSLTAYSDLFQAPMRHPLLMDQMMSAYKQIACILSEDHHFDEMQYNLDSTKATLEKVNLLFSQNFLIDGSFVNHFIILRNLLEKSNAPVTTKKLLDVLVETLEIFSQNNNRYFLDKSPKNKLQFEHSYSELSQLHHNLLKTGYSQLFETIIQNQDLSAVFYQKTYQLLEVFIPKIEEYINKGLALYDKLYSTKSDSLTFRFHATTQESLPEIQFIKEELSDETLRSSKRFNDYL